MGRHRRVWDPYRRPRDLPDRGRVGGRDGTGREEERRRRVEVGVSTDKVRETYGSPKGTSPETGK